MFHVVSAWRLAALALLASPAFGQPFEACADSEVHPALNGSFCTLVQVPMTPMTAAHEDSVALFVRKFPAVNPGRRGEIWFMAGGPGESGASFYPVLSALRRAFPNYDLVVPDHRGTGYSSKVCENEEAPDSPGGIALTGEEWGPCIAAMLANPGRTHAFSITNAAQDLSTLIARHRGDGEVYLYGVSYGTQLVLRMMQVAPLKLDGIILDGLIPPESAPQWDLSHRTRVVDTVGRAILAPAQESAYRKLLTQEQADWQAAVPGGDLRRFMGLLLSFPELRARIPDIVESLSRGDTALLARTAADLEVKGAQLYGFPQSQPSLPLVALISGSENNGRRDLTAETVAAEAGEALFTSPLPGLLVDSPVPLYERDRYFGGTPARLPRTLVIHGTLDPNTPYEGARAHVAALSPVGDVRLTTVQGGAHFLALVAPDCFARVTAAFVARQSTPDQCDAQ